MEWSRAFVVALKIIAVDFIFVVILLVLSYLGNEMVTVIGSLILLIVIIAVAVFFVLKEAEDMINTSFSVNQMEKELAREEAKSIDKALNWIKSDLDDTKFQSMIEKLIDNNKKQGNLHPEILLESQIKENMAQGKTKEQAIEELYAKIKRRPRAKKGLTNSEQKTN